MSIDRRVVGALVVSAGCIVGIASHESYMGSAYRDSVGKPTIGYGETKGVKMGQKTTPDRALVQLYKSVNSHADEIKKCISVPVYQHEYDAFVSASYNIGSAAFCRSTLVKKLNAGDYAGACMELKRWVYAGKPKRRLKGLVKRREAEYRTCIGK